MEIATIGFTRTSARSFFERIAGFGARVLLDVRLNNTSQLAGFAKRDDLPYFLQALCGVDYRELPELAPEQETLKRYRSKAIDWDAYAAVYRALLVERGVERSLDRGLFEPGAVLLCSEDRADHCHRRLAAEYLQSHWGDVRISHL